MYYTNLIPYILGSLITIILTYFYIKNKETNKKGYALLASATISLIVFVLIIPFVFNELYKAPDTASLAPAALSVLGIIVSIGLSIIITIILQKK
ncbi:MAG TPA: hypothetical protein VJK51_00125 [Candidatus Nanoarchaeia archaeon]|nr:hypothetical protein [Candidatus Nanoarchaeia archaeon]